MTAELKKKGGDKLEISSFCESRSMTKLVRTISLRIIIARHVYTEMNDLARITGYKNHEKRCQFAIFRLFHLIGAVAILFIVSMLLLNTYSFYHIDNYNTTNLNLISLFHMFNVQSLTGSAYAQAEELLLSPSNDSKSPVFHLPGFTAEIVVDGLVNHGGPTSIAFLGPDDFLILEKDEGTVLRVINGQVQKEPILDVNVSNTVEQCMCGIAVSKSNSATNETGSKTYIFIYFTESDEDGGAPIANRLYRYEFLDNMLVNPKLLLDLPGLPGPRHNGGAVKIGPDNNVYATIGDLEKTDGTTTEAQNNPDNPVDGTSGILRVSQDGKPVKDPTNDTYLFGNTFPLNLYYAYGVRNSFGIDFDPVTGNLWDTENGPAYGDELNLVKPGFNSGWRQVMGIWVFGEGDPREGTGTIAPEQPTTLVELGGIGSYQPPKFTWLHTIGPTAIKFLDSDKYGTEFKNDLFVGDIHNGIVYHFDLNKDRTQLVLLDPLADRIANTAEEAFSGGIVLATGFGGITDIEVNPYDGYMYVVSLGQGKIFKIIPSK